MLAPSNACRLLCRRTGGSVSRATFYRWLSSGKIFSIRLGHRIYIPLAEIDNVVKQCRAGERVGECKGGSGRQLGRAPSRLPGAMGGAESEAI